MTRQVWVRADPQTEAREKARLRAQEAHRRMMGAAEEFDRALAEVGPDPRVFQIDEAVGQFLDAVVGRPCIRDYA